MYASPFGDGGPPHRGILAKGETHGAQSAPGGGGSLEGKKRILPVTNGKRGNMLPPEEELLSDKDLTEASLEQLIKLRERTNLELQRRDVAEPSDPADPAEQPRPGESPERPASD